MAAFDYRQAQEIRDAFGKHQVRYLFIGNSGAILLGYPDTAQDTHVFVEKSAVNGDRLVEAVHNLGFQLTDQEAHEIRHGKDFVQLRDGPFDMELVFAPDGIVSFEDEGFPVCNIDDIVASKQAANRRDRESLPRLLSFREWLKKQNPV
jgi:hypothetical protein